MKKKKLPYLSIIFLILANLYSISGVLLFEWTAFDLIALFCAETFVVGFYNIIKMRNASDADKVTLWRLNAIPLSLLTYTLVIAFQISFFLFFTHLYFNRQQELSLMDYDENVWNFFINRQFFIALFLLTLSHGISYWFNYVRRKEYETLTVGRLVFAPFRRIIKHQTIVILGGLLLGVFKANNWFLILLILIKIVFDLNAHLNEHKIYVLGEVKKK